MIPLDLTNVDHLWSYSELPDWVVEKQVTETSGARGVGGTHERWRSAE